MNWLRRGSIVLVAALVPLAAAAAPAQQDPIPPPPQTPVAPHELIEAAGQLIDGLLTQQVLNKGQALSLRGKLGDAREALWRADAGAAIRRLRAYTNEVDALGQGGVLPAKDALALGDYGTAAMELVGGIAFRVPSVIPAVKLGCGQPVPCPQPLVLYVASAKARLNPDGGQETPFRTIAAALAAAEEAGACAVEIRLARGTYSGDIAINRNTRIIGEETRRTIVRGSIVDEGGHDLELRGLTVAASPAPGGVVVRACPANVELSSVLIDGATRHGVRQDGGALRMFAVQVRGTIAQSDDVYAGSGVRLTGGTRAVIGLSTIDGSGSVGLSVSDAQTRVYVAASLISNNRSNPSFDDRIPPALPGYGGAEVREGALLLMQFTTLRGNEILGLSAQSGGRVHFRYGSIAETTSRRIAGAGIFGGVNVLSKTDGVVHTTEFVSTRSENIGYRVSSGFATAFWGIISHNPIGLGFGGGPPPSDPGYTLPIAIECVCNALRAIRNDRVIEVPDPGDIVGGSFCSLGPPSPICRTVPLVCDWCGS